MARSIPKLVGVAAAALVAGIVAIQLVPYRVSNPPVVAGPAWANAETEQLARRACFDCHSNEVRVPWYGHVAPTSWLVTNHVNEARSLLNFSEMNREQEEAHEAGEVVSEGEMPPSYYTLLHPDARLTDAERDALARGLDATLGGEAEDHESGKRGRGGRDGERHHDDEDDEHDDG